LAAMMITRSFSNLELFEFDKLDCAIAPRSPHHSSVSCSLKQQISF
jgi:hypothetical protein